MPHRRPRPLLFEGPQQRNRHLPFSERCRIRCCPRAEIGGQTGKPGVREIPLRLCSLLRRKTLFTMNRKRYERSAKGIEPILDGAVMESDIPGEAVHREQRGQRRGKRAKNGLGLRMGETRSLKGISLDHVPERVGERCVR